MATITVTKCEEKAPLLGVEQLAPPKGILRRRTCDGTPFDGAGKPLLSPTRAVDTTSSSLSSQTTTGASSAAGGDVSALRRQISDSNLQVRRSMKRKQSKTVKLAPIAVQQAASAPPKSILAYTDTPITQFMNEVSYSQKPSVASAPDFSSLISSPSFTHRQDSKDSLMDILDIRIFYPDGRSVQFSVEGGADAEVRDLLSLMAEHMGLEEDDVLEAFSIWFVSPLLEVQLKPHHVAAQIRMQWPAFLRKFTNAAEGDVLLDNPLLAIKRNVGLNKFRELELAEKDFKILDLLYRDAKCSYLDGRIIVDTDTAVHLAALQMAADFEPYRNEEQTDTLMHKKLAHIIPDQHYSKIRSFHLFGIHLMECSQGMENQLKQDYKDCSINYPTREALRTEYLNTLRGTPFYGAAYFRGLVDRKAGPPSIIELGKSLFTGHHPLNKYLVRIGIQQDYVTIVDEPKNEILLTLRIDECTWIKEDQGLFFHFPEPESMAALGLVLSGQTTCAPAAGAELTSLLLRVCTPQAPMMADLLDGLSKLQDEYNAAHSVATPASPVSAHHPTSDYSDGNFSDTSVTSNPAAVSHTSRFSRESGEGCCPPVHVTENKLSKLCLATFDPKGRCIEAHGSIRRLLMVK
uniref:FERM domain-containing protein 8 n=1 Tax=Panagrellus redivivus TaxID=6233 RepID=A0A7E4ZWS5_PANRE